MLREEDSAAKVAELLPTAFHLSRAATIQTRISSQQRSIQTTLSAAAEEQTAAAEKSIVLLDNGKSELLSIRGGLDGIGKLCSSTTNLIDQYTLMKKIAICRANARAVLRDVETLMDVSKCVQELQLMALDEKQVLPMHQRLRKLRALEEAVKVRAKTSGQSVFSALEKEFRTLDDFDEKLYGNLKRIFMKAFERAKQRPALLVQALRVVQRQERMDNMVEEDKRKRFKELCINTIKSAIFQRFDLYFAGLESEILAPPDLDALETDDPTPRLLKNAEEMFGDLDIVKAHMGPCFPPEYEVQRIYAVEYHKQYHLLIVRFANVGTNLSAKDTILLVKWVRGAYASFLKKQGLDGLQPPLIEPLTDLLLTYREHVRKLMKDWTMRVLETDRKSNVEEINGLLYTDAPLTFFKIVNDQIQVAQATAYPRLVFEVLEECAESILLYQSVSIDEIKTNWETMTLDYLIAVVNNSKKSEDFMRQLQDKIAKILDQAKKDNVGGIEGEDEQEMNWNVDLSTHIDGFKPVATEAIEGIGRCIIRDITETLKVVGSKEWKDVVDTYIYIVVDTIEDYIVNEVKGCVADSYIEFLAEKVMNEVIILYASEHFHKTNKATIDTAYSKRLIDDMKCINEMFSKFLNPDIVDRAQRIINAINILSVGGVDEMVQIATTVIPQYRKICFQDANDVKKILTRRMDVTSAQKKAVMDALEARMA